MTDKVFVVRCSSHIGAERMHGWLQRLISSRVDVSKITDEGNEALRVLHCAKEQQHAADALESAPVGEEDDAYDQWTRATTATEEAVRALAAAKGGE